MLSPTYTLLYVDSPIRSAAFYAGLFGCEPVELAPTFALFVFPSGLKLGLWLRSEIRPTAGSAGGGEISMTVDGNDAVDALYAAWDAKGVTMLQPPTDLDFGRNFLAGDPDGHRLRIFAPAMEPAAAAGT